MEVKGYTFVFLVFWCVLFWIVFYCTHGCSFKFRNTLVALVHDVGAVVLPTHCLLTSGVQFERELLLPQVRVLSFSLGYFVPDLCLWLYRGWSIGEYDYKQVSHHCFCILGTLVCFVTGRSGTEVVVGLLLSHVNSPFGYVRFLTKEAGLQDTRLSTYASRLHFTTKLVSIGVFSPPVVFEMVKSSVNHTVVKVCAVSVLVVNLLWLHTIGRKYLGLPASTLAKCS